MDAHGRAYGELGTQENVSELLEDGRMCDPITMMGVSMLAMSAPGSKRAPPANPTLLTEDPNARRERDERERRARARAYRNVSGTTLLTGSMGVPDSAHNLGTNRLMGQ